MDSDSPDKKEVFPKISRRAVLGGTIAGVVGTLAAPLAAHFMKPKDETEVNLKPPSPEEPELANFIDNHPILTGLSPEEKQVAAGWVAVQIEHYQTADLTKRIADSARWEKMVAEKAKNLGYRTDSPIPDIVPALIFVESEGDPEVGLCQILPDAARENALDLNIDLGESLENLTNPDVNTTLALNELARLKPVFIDPSLILWAYHLGEGNLTRAIFAYVQDQNPFAKFSNQSTPEPDTAIYSRNLHLNFVNMIKSEEVQKSLHEDLKTIKAGNQEIFGDDTLYYVSRILAADYLMKNYSNQSLISSSASSGVPEA